ncbi:MAG: hypothetical protein ACKVSF_14565 [Alphaproteobacteria bacterium]
MASDEKKIKNNPAPETAAAATTAPVKSEKAAEAVPSKAESGEKADAAPAGYSRGEGQKPISKAYKDNWDAIFGKKKNK